MRQRAISAAAIVPAVLVVLAAGGPILAVAVAALTVVAAVEAYHLLIGAGYAPFTVLGTVLAVAIVLDAAFPGVLEGSGLLLSGAGAVIIAIASFMKVDPRDGLQAWVVTVFGAVYVSLLAFVVRLGQDAPGIAADAPLAALDGGRGWVLLLVMAVWSFDTGAYLVGRAIGRTPFLAHISPSKTLEGVIGGIVASTIIVAVGLALLGQNPLHAVVLGPLTAIAAQAGDLAESMLKRAAGAKDSGTWIPGHGGILDRVDSVIFAAPIMTLYVVALVR